MYEFYVFRNGEERASRIIVARDADHARQQITLEPSDKMFRGPQVMNFTMFGQSPPISHFQ